jgi:carboxyl-terminal processing protease
MRQWNRKWVAVLVAVLFLWSRLAGIALAADNKILSEVAGLLKANYVDPVSAQVLQAPTVDEMLKRLGDPYAEYYTRQQFQDEMDALNGSLWV